MEPHPAKAYAESGGGRCQGSPLSDLFNQTTRATVRRDAPAAISTLEALRECGFVQSHGRGGGANYTLSPTVYASLGSGSEYTRQAGFAVVQQEQMVTQYARKKGQLGRADVMDLCGIGKDQASRLLRRLVEKGVLVGDGNGRWRKYRPSNGADGSASSPLIGVACR